MANIKLIVLLGVFLVVVANGCRPPLIFARPRAFPGNYQFSHWPLNKYSTIHSLLFGRQDTGIVVCIVKKGPVFRNVLFQLLVYLENIVTQVWHRCLKQSVKIFLSFLLFNRKCRMVCKPPRSCPYLFLFVCCWRSWNLGSFCQLSANWWRRKMHSRYPSWVEMSQQKWPLGPLWWTASCICLDKDIVPNVHEKCIHFQIWIKFGHFYKMS